MIRRVTWLAEAMIGSASWPFVEAVPAGATRRMGGGGRLYSFDVTRRSGPLPTDRRSVINVRRARRRCPLRNVSPHPSDRPCLQTGPASQIG